MFFFLIVVSYRYIFNIKNTLKETCAYITLLSNIFQDYSSRNFSNIRNLKEIKLSACTDETTHFMFLVPFYSYFVF